MKNFAPILFLLSGFTAFAQEPTVSAQRTYTQGVHYNLIEPAYETSEDEQVIVYEFFSYKCPHCSSFQPHIKPWHNKLPEHIKLVRIPVVFQDSWKVFAKAYYTAETMGIIEKTHQPFFNAIHKQLKRLNTIEDVATWFADNFQVDRDAFLSTANSFMIDSKIRQSKNLTRKMQITSTPTVIVNGKFKPDTKKLPSIASILDMSLYLANQEAVRMGLNK
jgi:thiol:disulfide interchange protein DsbA